MDFMTDRPAVAGAAGECLAHLQHLERLGFERVWSSFRVPDNDRLMNALFNELLPKMNKIDGVASKKG